MNVQRVVVSSAAKSIFVVGGFLVERDVYSTESLFVVCVGVTGCCKFEPSICWVETSANSSADRRLQTLSVGRRSVTAPCIGSIRHLGECGRLEDQLYGDCR